jgi:hypothetical protein
MHVATGRMALKTILIISLIAFVTQTVGGLVFGSLSVLSDGLHSLLDNVGNIFRLCVLSIPLMIPLLLSRCRDNKETETFKSVVSGKLLVKLQRMDVDKTIIHSKRFNSVMLPVTGIILILSGGYRLFHPHSIHADMSIWIAVVGLVCNLIQIAVFLVLEVKEHMKDVFLHLLGDTLHSIFALLAMVVIWCFGDDYRSLDALLTIWLGGKMVKWGISLLEEMTPQEMKEQFPEQRVWMIGSFTILLRKKHAHSGCGHHDEVKSPCSHSEPHTEGKSPCSHSSEPHTEVRSSSVCGETHTEVRSSSCLGETITDVR